MVLLLNALLLAAAPDAAWLSTWLPPSGARLAVVARGPSACVVAREAASALRTRERFLVVYTPVCLHAFEPMEPLHAVDAARRSKAFFDSVLMVDQPQGDRVLFRYVNLVPGDADQRFAWDPEADNPPGPFAPDARAWTRPGCPAPCDSAGFLSAEEFVRHDGNARHTVLYESREKALTGHAIRRRLQGDAAAEEAQERESRQQQRSKVVLAVSGAPIVAGLLAGMASAGAQSMALGLLFSTVTGSAPAWLPGGPLPWVVGLFVASALLLAASGAALGVGGVLVGVAERVAHQGVLMEPQEVAAEVARANADPSPPAPSVPVAPPTPPSNATDMPKDWVYLAGPKGLTPTPSQLAGAEPNRPVMGPQATELTWDAFYRAVGRPDLAQARAAAKSRQWWTQLASVVAIVGSPFALSCLLVVSVFGGIGLMLWMPWVGAAWFGAWALLGGGALFAVLAGAFGALLYSVFAMGTAVNLEEARQVAAAHNATRLSDTLPAATTPTENPETPGPP